MLSTRLFCLVTTPNGAVRSISTSSALLSSSSSRKAARTAFVKKAAASKGKAPERYGLPVARPKQLAPKAAMKVLATGKEQVASTSTAALFEGSNGGQSIFEQPAEEQAREEEPAAGEYGPPEDIYTSPSDNAPLKIVFAFVLAVFCTSAADWSISAQTWNADKAEYEKYKWRYAIAGGWGAIAVGSVYAAVRSPARLVTKLTIQRPLNATSPLPQNSRLQIHTVLSKLRPFRPKPTLVRNVHLLGPLSSKPQSWHPRPSSADVTGPFKRKEAQRGTIMTVLDNVFPIHKVWGAQPSGFEREKQGLRPLSHAPLAVEGHRGTYQLALRRGDDGAWAKDWTRLERALLHLPDFEELKEDK